MICLICGNPSGTRQTCSRTCENRLWAQNNPEAYRAARDRYNEKRRELRKTNPGYGRRTHHEPKPKQAAQSYISRILSFRDAETKRYGR